MKEADRIVILGMDKLSNKKVKNILSFLEQENLEFYAESEDGDSYPISKKDIKNVLGKD